MIMDVAGDQSPLLISESNGLHGFGDEIESVMVAPLTIRKKIFGVLTTISLKGAEPIHRKRSVLPFLYDASCGLCHRESGLV